MMPTSFFHIAQILQTNNIYKLNKVDEVILLNFLTLQCVILYNKSFDCFTFFMFLFFKI